MNRREEAHSLWTLLQECKQEQQTQLADILREEVVPREEFLKELRQDMTHLEGLYEET